MTRIEAKQNLLKKKELLLKLKESGLSYSQMGKVANEINPNLFPKKLTRQRIGIIITYEKAN